jgi:lipopolysaccharide/colanic/teichoic acid biosynthesis glycosyltransferase
MPRPAEVCNPAIAGASACLDVQRILDILVVVISLPLALPLMMVISIAIRLDSPGPALFAQERLGRGLRPFRCFKFRTMTDGCDASTWTQRGDGRITRLGRWLRRSHLDELPQLWNVLKGEMAIVGPRPLRRSAAAALGILDHPRWRVRPGITGWAQIMNGSPVTVEEQLAKCASDAEYVAMRSLWLDIRIMAWTAWAILRMKGI